MRPQSSLPHRGRVRDNYVISRPSLVQMMVCRLINTKPLLEPRLAYVIRWQKSRNLPVNSPHKGQWRRALMFSLICAWKKNGWVNNREAGDLRRHRAHYDVIVMHLSEDWVNNHMPVVMWMYPCHRLKLFLLVSVLYCRFLLASWFVDCSYTSHMGHGRRFMFYEILCTSCTWL